MSMQSMNCRQQGGPMAGTVQPIPPSAVHHPLDYLLDDDPFDDDDNYLASPTHRSSSKRRRVAATSEAILSLPEVTCRSHSEGECAVCHDDFRAGETLRPMPCSHAFHHHCISQWLLHNAANAACPLCRHRLASYC